MRRISTPAATVPFVACVLAVAGLTGPAVAAPPVPDHGSCAAFGENVAGLAQTLGGDFGATASSVARSGAGAFPALVVHPEQATLCEPRP